MRGDGEVSSIFEEEGDKDNNGNTTQLILIGTSALVVLIVLGCAAYWASQQRRNACRRGVYQFCSPRREDTLTEEFPQKDVFCSWQFV